jgi:hypothetical protein
MYVQSNERPEPGANIQIIVRFQRAPTVSIPARVCRTTTGGFAVHFDGLGQLASDAIRKVTGNT